MLCHVIQRPHPLFRTLTILLMFLTAAAYVLYLHMSAHMHFIQLSFTIFLYCPSPYM